MDGRNIALQYIISSCQSAATSEDCKAFLVMHSCEKRYNKYRDLYLYLYLYFQTSGKIIACILTFEHFRSILRRSTEGSFYRKRKIHVPLSKLAKYSSFRRIQYNFRMYVDRKYKLYVLLVLAAVYRLKWRLNVFNVGRKSLVPRNKVALRLSFLHLSISFSTILRYNIPISWLYFLPTTFMLYKSVDDIKILMFEICPCFFGNLCYLKELGEI